MHKKVFIGVIPSILLSQFVITYFTQIEEISFLYFPFQFFTIFLGILYVLIIYKQSNIVIRKPLGRVYLYSIFLLLAILLSSVFASDAFYSSIRGIITVFLFAILFTIFFEMNKTLYNKENWQNFFPLTFFLAMLIIIFGQLLLPGWDAGSGGIRLSGGTNPNQVSFFALFVIFVSHYLALIKNHWQLIHILNIVMGVIIIFWSLSRSVIMSLIIFYVIYFAYTYIKKDANLLLKGKLTVSMMKRVFFLVIISFIGAVGYWYLTNLPSYEFVSGRFSVEENLGGRGAAWEILLNKFSKNPLFGGVGWWNGSNIVDGHINTATSPHNLYVRLLAETGITGFLVVLALPIIICSNLIFNAIKSTNYQKKQQFVLVFGFLIAIFAGQLFEDRYLVGVQSLGNSIFVWGLAVGLFSIYDNEKTSQDEK